jgi:HdeA/HdeB family protein
LAQESRHDEIDIAQHDIGIARPGREFDHRGPSLPGRREGVLRAVRHYKVANPKNIAIWLNGYHHGVRGDTVIDTQQLDEDNKKIQQYCVDNPNTPLMQAVETVIGPRN